MRYGFGETPTGLSTNIMNLANVLSRGQLLRIPRYQRPFTWTERQVRQLMQDLVAAFDRDASFYFIGQFVFVKTPQGDFEIADGQQRLITLTLLLAYVRERLPAYASQFQSLIVDPESDIARLQLRRDTASFFKGFVQEPGRLRELGEEKDENGVDAINLLTAAVQTIESELGEKSDAILRDLMLFVCNRAIFTVVDADERGHAGVIFYALNDPGLALSAADNTKAELLENSGLEDDEAEEASQQWEALEERLGRTNFAKLLDYMPFLLTGDNLVSPKDLSEFRMRVQSACGVRSFLFDRLPRYADALQTILYAKVSAGSYSQDINRRLVMLMQFEDWYWMPAALAYLVEQDDDHARAQRYFLALERFAWACDLNVIDNSDIRQRRLAQAARHAHDEDRLFFNGEKGRILELSRRERLRFIDQINRSRKSEKLRRLLIRAEAAAPGGVILTTKDDVEVEHILPKSGGPAWNEIFPDPKRREHEANLLGNMVLVTHDQNRRAARRSFAEKREVYFENGAQVYALTNDIRSVPQWTRREIGKRHDKLMSWLCADWDILSGINERSETVSL